MTPDAKLQIFAIKRGDVITNFSIKYAMFIFKYGRLLAKHRTLKEFLSQPLSNGIFVPPQLFGTGTKLVNVFDLYQGPYVQENTLESVQITKQDEQKYSAITGDVLFCRSSIKPEGVGWTSYIKSTKKPLVYECHIIRARLNKEIEPAFLSYFAQTKLCRNYILANASITTMATIPQEVIERIPLICPSLETQQRLVKKLEIAYGIKIQKLQQAEELLAGMDEFVLKTLGIHVPSSSKFFCWAITLWTLKASNSFSPEYFHPERLSIIDALKNSSLPTFSLNEKVIFKRDLLDSKSSDYQFLGLASVQSNTGERISSEDEVAGSSFKYNSGDVLYCRLRPYLNKVYFAEESGICSTEFHVMEPKNDSILPEYLAVIMRSKLILCQTKHMMTGNTHPRISDEDVKALVIPVPSKKVQQKIVDEYKIRTSRARQLRQEAEKEWQDAREQFEKELLGE